MATGNATGRAAFLAQRARLRASLATTRTNDTASRYNRLDETQRKVLFMLANSVIFHGLPQLTRDLLNENFERLSEQHRRTLMLGIKRLSELAGAIPWEFMDIAAPHHDALAAREKVKPETH